MIERIRLWLRSVLMRRRLERAGGLTISTLLFSYVHSYAVSPPQGMERADDLVRIRGSDGAGAAGRGSRTFTETELDAYRQLTSHFRDVSRPSHCQVSRPLPRLACLSWRLQQPGYPHGAPPRLIPR